LTEPTNQPVNKTEIHRGMFHQVFRITNPAGSTFIVKQAIDDGAALSKLRNEQQILDRLRGVAGCPCLVQFEAGERKLVMDDFGGIALSQADLSGRIDLAHFLSLSEALVLIVVAIHERGIIHKDINPNNILIRLKDLQPQIIDFDLSTTFAREIPEFDHHSRMQGTPAYLSPEQTGRMNRPVDYRTDLYSLGATLYELATGAPPFEETDLLSLIHAHLARTPRPPQERAAWLPQCVSDLILTLLAKEPDERYQSAAGLAHDLRLLCEALGQKKPLDQVQLRQHDVPLSLRPPQRLYGRGRELVTLMNAFASVTRGGIRSLFVAGYSGVGKTTLIHEIHRPVALGHGLFLSGKFEQFQLNRPFLAPAQSLNQLCQLLLAEPDDVITVWRERILDGIGQDASVLFAVVPDLEMLLGPQPPAPELGPLETQTRLRTLLVALVRQVAAPSHPLVLFLDDLQWADQPSMEFIEALLAETTLNGLLLIGAYRDNEVDASHPLMRLLRLLRLPTPSDDPECVLTLSNLTVGQVADLLSDMLHISPDSALPLAAALHARTSGNPFFTIEFVNMLYREGVLHIDHAQGIWRWDIDAIFSHPASANVVDFLTAQLTELTPQTAAMLTAAACLGNECTLGTLALAAGADPDDLVRWLVPALEFGMLDTPNALAFSQAAGEVLIRFCHDRMQQAAYHLCSDEERARLHLAIARRFLQTNNDPGTQFTAAEHYAAASGLITAPEEQTIARGLFMNAAVQSRQVGAFAGAERFLRLGIGLLAADAWDRNMDEAFAFYAELHLVLYRQARMAQADEVYALLEAHSDSPERLVDPACIQIGSLSTRTDYEGGVQLGSALLGKLGVVVPVDDPLPALNHELELLYQLAESQTEEFLPDRLAQPDKGLVARAKLMNCVAATASHHQPMITGWVSVRNALQWNESGYLDNYISLVSALIITTIALRGDYAIGYRVARRALEMGLIHERGIETAIVQHIIAVFVNHWFRPLEENMEYARVAFNGMTRAGDLEYAAVTFVTNLTAILETAAELSRMHPEIASALTFVRKTGNRHAEQSYLPYRQVVRALEGATASRESFDDADFQEQEFLSAARNNPQALCIFHVFRALAAAIYADDRSLTLRAEMASSLTPYILGVYTVAVLNFLHSLALLQQIRAADSVSGRAVLLERLNANQTWLAARAADAPMNFAHLYDLVQAERLDLLNQPWEALALFEQAMRKAQGNQRPWHHALITERAGQFYLRRGLEYAGQHLLARAYHLYRQWGANGKVQAMQQSMPFLDSSHPGSSTSSREDDLDYEALLRATRVLSSETSQTRLVERVVELLGQLTGATDTRLLLLDEDNQWQLEGGRRGQEILEHMSLAEAKQRRIVAASVFQLVLKTFKPIVSDDAVIDNRFIGDPHFAGLPLCSLLALPVLAHGRVSALLTLENRLTRAAFTESRVETVAVLCGQLAISIENVRLYQSLERKVTERTAELSEANDRLQQLSELDGLTGVSNRRKFDLTLDKEWRRALRGRQSLAVLMIDLDHFKAYNDQYGHQAGDQCLQRVAGILRSAVRRSGDLVARYGGEEFVAILPGLDKQLAGEVAEKMRNAIESQRIEHIRNTPFEVVTISVGVGACIPMESMSMNGLVEQADACLYRAKNSGRNRVV